MKTLRTVVFLYAALMMPSIVQSATYYFHTDHLGTPQAVSDKNQLVVWQGQYNPFGEVLTTVADIEQNLRFPGQYYDKESELHYNYFRDYDAGLGRYIQSDPMGLEGGLNTYGYVYQNPVKYIDPFGLDVNVSMNSSGAGGFGHVGGAANSSQTSGFYPSFPSTLAPGVVKPDENIDGEVVIPATPEQDKKFHQCMENRRINPGVYAISSRNCTRLVQSCLSQSGIKGFNNSTLPKRFFCSIAKKYGCEGEACNECDK